MDAEKALAALAQLAKDGCIIDVHDASYGRTPTIFEVIITTRDNRCGGSGESLSEAIQNAIKAHLGEWS